MIEKMKVVHIVAAASEKTALLDRLRTLGIVHFAEKASADQRHLERFAELSRMDMALQEYAGPGRETAPMSDKDFEPFYKELADCLERRKTLQEKKTELRYALLCGEFLPGGAAGAEGPGLRHPRLPDG